MREGRRLNWQRKQDGQGKLPVWKETLRDGCGTELQGLWLGGLGGHLSKEPARRRGGSDQRCGEEGREGEDQVQIAGKSGMCSLWA